MNIRSVLGVSMVVTLAVLTGAGPTAEAAKTVVSLPGTSWQTFTRESLKVAKLGSQSREVRPFMYFGPGTFAPGIFPAGGAAFEDEAQTTLVEATFTHTGSKLVLTPNGPDLVDYISSILPDAHGEIVLVNSLTISSSKWTGKVGASGYKAKLTVKYTADLTVDFGGGPESMILNGSYSQSTEGVD